MYSAISEHPSLPAVPWRIRPFRPPAYTRNYYWDEFWVPDMITYQQLIDAEAVADLTTLYQTEANPTLKELVEGEGDNFLDCHHRVRQYLPLR